MPESLEQLLATPLGFKPTIQKLQDLIENVIINRDAIAVIDPSPPTWEAPSDTRANLVEIGGAANNYAGLMANAGVGDILYDGAFVRMYRAGGIAGNSGACTLDAGTDDGAKPINKIVGNAFLALSAGDMPSTGAMLYYSADDGFWILINPVSANSHHVVVDTLGAAGDYAEGDFVYVKE